MRLLKQLQSLGGFLKYALLTLAIGLSELIAAIYFEKKLAINVVAILTVIYFIIFVYRYLYYRLFINKYLARNLKYLGDKYRPPFLSRTFLNGLLLAGKEETDFTDVKALTYYKEQKILEILGIAFAVCFAISAIILIIR